MCHSFDLSVAFLEEVLVVVLVKESHAPLRHHHFPHHHHHHHHHHKNNTLVPPTPVKGEEGSNEAEFNTSSYYNNIKDVPVGEEKSIGLPATLSRASSYINTSANICGANTMVGGDQHYYTNGPHRWIARAADGVGTIHEFLRVDHICHPPSTNNNSHLRSASASLLLSPPLSSSSSSCLASGGGPTRSNSYRHPPQRHPLLSVGPKHLCVLKCRCSGGC